MPLYSKKRIWILLAIVVTAAWCFRDFWYSPFRFQRVENPRASIATLLIGGWRASCKIEKADEFGSGEMLDLIIGGPPKSMLMPATGDVLALTSGRVLPDELLINYGFGSRPYTHVSESLHQGSLLIRDYWEYEYVQTVTYASYKLTESDSRKLVKWMRTRSDELPPSRMDVLAIWCLNVNFLGEDWFLENTEEDWAYMSTAPNPVYRLLANSKLAQVRTEPVQLRARILASLQETSAPFHHLAISLSHRLSVYDPEIESALRTFVDRGEVQHTKSVIDTPQGPRSLFSKAQDAIHRISTFPRTDRRSPDRADSL